MPKRRMHYFRFTSPNRALLAFTYDSATGRLTGTSNNGGVSSVAYSYLGEAEIMAADSAGNQTIALVQRLGLAVPHPECFGWYFHIPLR